MKFLFLALYLVVLSISGWGQEISLRGRITDASTGDPIPFASIAIADLYKGTSSNLRGEFLLKLDSLPVRLIFSHISYHKQEIQVDSPEYFEVRLTPGEILLDTLVIEDEEKGEYAYELLYRALNVAVQHSRDWDYGLAFYRQTSQNTEDYSELYEIFYDTRFSSQGIVDWAIQEGRYAMKTGYGAIDFVYNKNFTLLTRLVTMFQPQTDKFVMPVNENVRDLYDVRVRGLTDIQGRKVAVIDFTPREDIYIPAMEGTIYIDIDTYEILKLHGAIRNDNLELVALNNPMGTWKNLVLEFEAAFKPMDEKLYLDYITVTQSFDYFIDNVYHHPVKTTSFLTYYEYYKPDKFKRLGGRIIRYGNRDRDMLDRIGYNRRFWEDNPIVMRTPVEEEVISSFEAQNAFGSIYLNDRDQVQLEKDDLAKDPFIQQIQIDLRKSKLPTSGEKVYLHTDLPYYASGETIWFNAYIVNLATLVPSNLSGVMYVDLISPEGDILVNKRLDIKDAYAEGNIDLPADYPTGKYRLRAYTNWMRNYDPVFFFDRELDIYYTDQVLKSGPSHKEESNNFDVQFLPEGGNLISGISGQIAFKAIDEKGRGIEVTGKIVNEKGGQVAEIITRHDGMGSFFFMPQPGVKFSAEVKYNGQKKVFALPEALPSGYCLTVNNLKDKSIQVMVKSSPDLNDSEFYLIGQTRGVIYHREKGTLTKGSAIIDIPKSKIPTGIFQITLFDSLHTPRCERLVFIHNDPGIFVDMKVNPEIFRARDKIKLHFELSDQFGRSIRDTQFSVAVTDANHVMKQATDENIMTNLLLTSDLQGNIENPGFYFLDDDRDTRIALDMVMLTHGWRRFTWKEIFDDELAETPFSHESGINLNGKALIRGTRNPLKNAYINLMSIRQNFPGYWSTTTDLAGNFNLNDLKIPDTLQVVTISVDAKGKPMSIELQIDSIMPAQATQKEYQQYPPPVNEEIMNYLARYNERDKIEDAYHYSDRVVMKEIEVRGARENYDRTIYGEPDAVIKMDDQLRAFTDIFQIIQGRIPGVTVTGQGINATIRIRGVNSFTGNTDPLIVVDGLPISNIGSSRTASPTDSTSGSASAGGPDFNSSNSILLSISPMDVDRIEVLKNASAAIYGVRGGNGVILIYTRRGGEEPERRLNEGYGDVILPGFSSIREFYSPAYDVPSEEHIMPDKRTTVYWDPSIRTNNLGKAEIEFFNSDDARNLQIEIQGVSDFGDIINAILPVGTDLIK